MRRHLAFSCEGSLLAATLDDGPGSTGLLLVSGGNEVRAGAWNGQAQFAARIAAAGFPVFRFDRRGIGDSEGGNGGFRTSVPDIAAALAAFRAACPQLTRVVGLGNCDAASALMLARGAGLDALILSNPWTLEDEAAPAPPAAIRDHYRRRLADPAALLRLLSGKVSPRKLIASLGSALRRPAPQNSLVQELAAGITGFAGEVVFLVAGRDRTGQTFTANWDSKDQRVRRCPDATHSYVERHAREWLVNQVTEALQAQSSSRT